MSSNARLSLKNVPRVSELKMEENALYIRPRVLFTSSDVMATRRFCPMQNLLKIVPSSSPNKGRNFSGDNGSEMKVENTEFIVGGDVL